MGVPLWPSVSLALSLSMSLVTSESNLRILSLPVNVTSWRLSFKSALNYSLDGQLHGLGQTLQGYVDFVRNGSIGCSLEGEQCIPETPSCCPAIKENDTELNCKSEEGLYFCRKLNDSEEEAQQRLDDLENGNSIEIGASHAWTDDWAFQSKSAIEREEEQAAEEALWRKNWIPNPVENMWLRTYGKLKHSGKEIWHDLRKFKKLRELKEKLINKYKARVAKDKEADNISIKKGVTSSIMYPDDNVEEGNYETDKYGQRRDSEESVIKFSDEMPKKEKKIDFKLDDIIKDAVTLVGKKIKKKLKPYKERKDTSEIQFIPKSSAEIPIHKQEIEGTEDKLRKEIEELKVLRKIKKHPEINYEKSKLNEPNIDELIRSQVNAILQEERKLDKLRKIEELRRLEQGMIKKNN